MDPSKSEPDPWDVPRHVKEVMARFERPWFLAGGWAIDLFVGRVTRPHEDVEVAILREDQARIRDYLGGWELDKVVKEPEGGRREPWRRDERLTPPIHEIHARRERGEPRELEILLNEAEAGRWRFRRDPRIARPVTEIGFPAIMGIPILAPEIVLLYKAKAPRPRDEEDFRNALPLLGPERRRWLRRALATAHPGHRWMARLGGHRQAR